MTVSLPRAMAAALRLVFGLRDPSDPSRNPRAIIADSVVRVTALLCGSFFPIVVLNQVELARLSTDVNPFANLLGVLVILLVTALFYPLAVLICLLRKRWGTLILAMPIAHWYLLERLNNSFFDFRIDLPQALTGAIVMTLSAISLAWFSQSGRIFSRSFALVCALILYIFPGVVASLMLVMCLFLRFFLLACRQNIEVLRPIGWFRSARLLLLSLLYWAPILLLAVPGYYWVDYSHRYTLAAMTCLVTDPGNHRLGDWPGNCIDEEIAAERSIPEFREHVIKQTRSYYNRRIADVNRWQKNALANPVKLRKLDVGNSALGLYDSVIPGRIDAFEPRDCKLLDLSCGAGNVARGSLRASYQSVRNEQRAEIREALGGNSRQGKAKQVDEAARTMRSAVGAVEKAHLESLNATFVVLETLALIGLIMLLFVGLRSLLYVFARVAFGTDAQAYVSLRDDAAEMPHGRIRHAGGECVIDLDKEGEFYAARKYQPQGQAPRFSLPRPGAAALARIVNGCWGLNRLEHREGSPRVRFSASQGQEFVVWELAADEIVVFDYEYFVAMSASLRLFSIISLRISSLLFGKIIFPAARGPGKLVLKTYGKPSRRRVDESIAVSIAPGRLLAWQKNTRFAVDSTLSFVDIYLSGFYMRPQEYDLIVIDVDRLGERESGLGRFAKNFLMPW